MKQIVVFVLCKKLCNTLLHSFVVTIYDFLS